MKDIELLLTADGSHTLYDHQLGESYHCHKGAMAEAQHVFIDAGLLPKLAEFADTKKPLQILEVGFGTGLNALLTALKVLEHWCAGEPIEIHYHTLEPFPLAASLIQQLNYGQLISMEAETILRALHQTPWGETVEIVDGFFFTRHQQRLEAYQHQAPAIDLIYYDAFAPKHQADVWSIENFSKCYQWLLEQGMLVSYCANGQFKRNLKAAGFVVKKHPGALGKREMTRAWRAKP